ncbi:TPA: hypothetical protein MYR09_004163 [Citrobacter farmeri]|uniref:hypothetical protein n=1 Tax=Citrobacter farmeri TaxID=67824 RepID=UPI00388EBB44|nr:hypothetical protein [Citrobacter farmeri]
MIADVSNGPVSTLPGRICNFPAGTKCDEHPERDAVKRVQGETDSFGCEYHDMCLECHDQYVIESNNADYSGKCDWCGKHADLLVPHRDIEEGSYGRVYDVCKPCIDAERQRWEKEDEQRW